MSLRYGAGDLHWFSRLPREDKATMIALDRIDNPPPPTLAEKMAAAMSKAPRVRG